jgi:cAMP phosphodiesterase
MLIDNDVLIDAGTGIGDLSLADLNSIRHVFLTHAHLDHVAGLPMLVDANFAEDFEIPVTVYARTETLDAIRDHLFNDVIWPDFTRIPNRERAMLQFQECNPGDLVRVGSREFQAVDVRHSVPSLGFTARNSHGRFAVSGDTRTNETLWPVLNACDDLKVLVIEVSFPDEQRELAETSGHYCPMTMCRDLERLDHDPAIWLTGMKPGEEERILAQVLETAPHRDIHMLARGTVIVV